MLSHLLDNGDLLRSRTCHERSFDHFPGLAGLYGSARMATGVRGEKRSALRLVGRVTTLSAPCGAPEFYGEIFSCGASLSDLDRLASWDRALAQAVAASRSSTTRALAGSIFTPGPMVELSVTDRR